MGRLPNAARRDGFSSCGIVTFTSDFGTRDAYAAAMKAAVLRQHPAAVLVDVTHQVAPQDILSGSIAIERAVDAFSAGTIHVAVIDPGVGTQRRLLVVRIRGQLVLCPDNGLITWAWRRLGDAKAFELIWRPRKFSQTFHGRDILAPAAGMLAAGRPLAQVAKPATNPVLLDIAPARRGAKTGRIIHIDHFGNATINISRQAMAGMKKKRVQVGGIEIGPVQWTYADARPGEALALFGSADLLEIAVRNGSAAIKLGIGVGDIVRLK